jgi:vitamin B12 transporter
VSLAYAVPGHSFKLAAYRNDFRDLISSGTTDCAAGSFCYYNVGQARVEGLTLSGATQLGRYALKGAVDWLDPKNEVTGKFLTLRPRQQAFFSVSRPWGVWDAGVHVRLVSRRYDNAANTVVLPGYGLLGLVASRPLAPNLSLVLRTDNLGDRRYQQIGTLDMPGRTFFATLNWQSR